MKNKIRKAIREQIKKLHESNQTLIVTSEDGVEVQITDPRDIQDFLSGKGTVYGEDQDGGSVEVSIDNALDHKMTEELGPRMKSPRPTGPSDPRSSKDIEFDNAQAMSRLTPDDKDTLEKIQQMMDKEKVEEIDFIDDEGNHAKMQLQKATEYSAKLAAMMGDIKQLPSWVQSKITKASDYMSSVYHYLDYETTGDQEDLTMETRPDWTPPPMGMGGEEKEDEEQEEYDKGWYGESLKEAASKLGYLKEVDGMEGGMDLNAVQYEKAEFVYSEQGGRFYGLDVYTSEGQKQKLRYDEANEWLKDTLAYIHEDDLIPRHYGSGLEDLDLIVDRLKELGIEASHNEYDFS